MLWWEINNATSVCIYSGLVINGLAHTAISFPCSFSMHSRQQRKHLINSTGGSQRSLPADGYENGISNAHLQNRWAWTINCFLFIISIKNPNSQFRSTAFHRITVGFLRRLETWPQDFSVSKKWTEEEIFLLRLAHTETRLNFCRESKISGIYFSELLHQHILELYFIPPSTMIDLVRVWQPSLV